MLQNKLVKLLMAAGIKIKILFYWFSPLLYCSFLDTLGTPRPIFKLLEATEEK